ncbi:hypothetical protein BGX27_001866 [Mortierella sp. AM989]|nr:hypothetical protein BGX27_001866 [Mortierella sp. AM989]
MLTLILILMSLTSLWILSSGSSAGIEQEQLMSPPHLEQRPQSLNPHEDPPALNKDVFSNDNIIDKIRERFERVRGKGARSSLKKIQFQFPKESEQDRVEREKRLKAVRDGFEHAWYGYKKHAWGHDEVRPVKGGFKDVFNGWGATMVDSLDTLVIMGFNKEFDEALEWVKTKFNMTKDPNAQLQFFETVIRYLGGLLGAYDLTGEKVLLEKAKELGGYLLNAFENRDFPASRFAVNKSSNNKPVYNFALAELGTIQLEFSRLSMLTNDPIFEQKGRRIIEVLSSATSDLPGLFPVLVQSGEGRHYGNFRATVNGMADSYYEYLIKEWILLDGKTQIFKDMFLKAVESIKNYMILSPDNGSKDYVIIGQAYSATKDIEPEMEHLACFMAGSLAMGSKYFDRPDDLVLARKVAEGCYLGYSHSVTGLGPESMKFEKGRDGKTIISNPNTFYNPLSSKKEYILRPETIESLWILYRLTGEKKYQDQAWGIFESIEANCRTKIAYSGLLDVTRKGSYDDKMESFFMAETMKYLYLMFSTPDVISLDDFVLNTEAHPLRRI